MERKIEVSRDILEDIVARLKKTGSEDGI